jgi:predicted TIM-barrel fold metal-dependent hydrolase
MSQKRDSANDPQDADTKSFAGTAIRIDVHHHVVPPEYVKALAGAGITTSMGNAFPVWSVQKDLELMDRLGLSTAVISISAPAANVPRVKDARAIARLCNEIAARMINDHLERFGAFATLPPLTDVEGALREIEYALDTLNLDGVALMTNYYLKYLGDSSFEEVYKALNRRKAVVQIHPNDPPGVQFGVSGGLMDAPFDTTRAGTNLICTGTMERYPDIAFILPHGGGTMPYLYFRIGEGVPFMWKGFNENAPKGFYEYLKRFYYDTAIVGPDVFPYLHSQVGTPHILIGTDYPFSPAHAIAQCLKGVDDYEGLDAEGRRAIEERSALALFPKLRKKGKI